MDGAAYNACTMSTERLRVLYGKLEGAGGIFARDPSGYLGIEAGIYAKHGLEISWEHVQGTEERYRRLETGEADISFLVGRASLQHFLESGATRIIGSSMNRCPYVLVAEAAIGSLSELRQHALACRETIARAAPLAETFAERAGLALGADVQLVPVPGDQHAYEALVGGDVQAALLPRPFSFLCEEKGCRRLEDWPDVVDDPLPITIEILERSLRAREPAMVAFVEGHREAVEFLKSHRARALEMLESAFGYAPSLAARTYDDYLVWLDERLTVDAAQVEKLMLQVAPAAATSPAEVSSRWIAPWALRTQV